MRLSADQLTALRNLARKQTGEEVDWIRIADARALTELGFAQRSRDGWTISPAGLAALKTEPEQEDGEAGAPAAGGVVRLGARCGGLDRLPGDANHD